MKKKKRNNRSILSVIFVSISWVTFSSFILSVKKHQPEQIVLNVLNGLLITNEKNNKIFFSGVLDNRQSFISKIGIEPVPTLTDTNGSYRLYTLNDTLTGRIKLDCRNLSKRVFNIQSTYKEKAQNLTIYRAVKMNGKYTFVRALISDGTKGTIYYFFLSEYETNIFRSDFSF